MSTSPPSLPVGQMPSALSFAHGLAAVPGMHVLVSCDCLQWYLCCLIPVLACRLAAARPGGYDVLFESLARQTSNHFELICIDDTGPMNRETGVRAAPTRRAAAVAYARRRGVPLVALVPSKKKVRGLRFGQCNAINSGLVLSSGKFITVVQDNVWLLPNFVERTLAFFSSHDRDVLLSYPERRVAPPAGRLKREWMNDTSVLRIFEPPVEEDPVAAGWEIQNFNNTMTEDIWGQIGKEAYIQTQWFECAACTASWELYAALNGLDEALDAGDDSQEANVKDRTVVLSERLKAAAARGGEGTPVGRVLHGGAGLGETWNDLGSPVILIDHHQFESDETWARFERDTNVYRWRAMKDLMEFEEYPVEAPNAFNLAAVRLHDLAVRAQALRTDEHGVVESVDWATVLPALDVGAVPMAQVEHVMKPRFGYKPEVLFVYARSEEEQHVWEDGLTRALREMRRHFHMTLMNIGHLRIEEQPEIDFQMKNTFHFFLGYGRFLGHADYFMRKYNEVVNPVKKDKGEQLVRFALMLHGGQHFPDEEALELYGALVADSQAQADELVANTPSLQDKIFYNLGIDPQHWTAGDGSAERRSDYDVVVVGDLTSASR